MGISGLSVLEKIGRDLTELARQNRLEPLIGREKEMFQLVRTLLSTKKPNPVLVGEPGTGKTALVEGFAQAVVTPEKAQVHLRAALAHLRVDRVIELPVIALSASSGMMGKLEENMQDIIREVEDSEGRIILFIDELHMLLGTGVYKGLNDAANLLKPALSRGRIRVIGATTNAEYQRYIMLNQALERRLSRVFVSEPGPAETVRILEESRPRLEKHFELEIPPELARQAVKLAGELLPNRRFPDKAIELLEQAACQAILTTTDLTTNKGYQPTQDQTKTQTGREFLDEIYRAMEQRAELTGQMPMVELPRSLHDFFPAATASGQADLKARSFAYPIFQPEPHRLRPVVTEKHVQAAAAAISGLREKLLFGPTAELGAEIETRLRQTDPIFEEVAKDLASGLVARFCGPERPRKGPRGVVWIEGGSEQVASRLANAIQAAVYYDEATFELYTQQKQAHATGYDTVFGSFEADSEDETALVDLDLGSFSEPHMVSQLIGSPPGYTGFDQGGQLTGALQNRPGGVVLLYRFAQSDPAVRQLLANAFSSGKLVDGQGRVTPLRHFIFILAEPSGEGNSRSRRPFGFVPKSVQVAPTAPKTNGKPRLRSVARVATPVEMAGLLDFTFSL
jgi:ATP-dependent Clp protease ATP-binding subunit ClpA